MATFLYELGRLAFGRRWLMALLWVVIFCGAGFAASSAPTPPADTFSMPGTESQKAFDLLEEKCFPTSTSRARSSPAWGGWRLRAANMNWSTRGPGRPWSGPAARRHWERPAEPGRLTPARVRRGFRNLRAHLPCPARAPNPQGQDRAGHLGRRTAGRRPATTWVERPDDPSPSSNVIGSDHEDRAESLFPRAVPDSPSGTEGVMRS